MLARDMKSTSKSRSQESVCGLLADLHLHQKINAPLADLKVSADQRRELVDATQLCNLIKIGDQLPRFRLTEVDGGQMITLDALAARGAAVIIFFRFAESASCNIALAYYQRRLYPSLKKIGASLVAISPQRPDKLAGIKRRLRLEFPVASDLGNELARKLGLLCSYNEASRSAALAKGIDIGAMAGTQILELPMPAVIVIDHTRTVRFADVSPDWMIRTEAEPILEALQLLVFDPVL